MPRLVHSMDALNEISVENLGILGSVDNLRVKKRRTRRPRKRTQSIDDLLKREERRQERIRKARNSSTASICNTEQLHNSSTRNSRTSLTRRSKRQSAVDESVESSCSSKDRPRPQTPTGRRKKRQVIRDEQVTDDEDSDIPTLGSNRSVIIKELKREPRSGYRESVVQHES